MPPKPRPKPPLDAPLRYATPSDTLRIGEVIYAGFEPTSEFRWNQPYHKQFHEDTLQTDIFDAAFFIDHRHHICVVVEDTRDANEAKYTGAILPDGGGAVDPEPDKVVVGLAVWRLSPESPWCNGTFSIPLDAQWPRLCLYPDEERCQHKEHVRLGGKLMDDLEEKHFGVCGMTLERLVIHPAYWRRGHGRRLLEWGMRFANSDGVIIGVCASSTGVVLYRALGFTLLETGSIVGDDVSPEGVQYHAMKYYPRKKWDRTRRKPEIVDDGHIDNGPIDDVLRRLNIDVDPVDVYTCLAKLMSGTL